MDIGTARAPLRFPLVTILSLATPLLVTPFVGSISRAAQGVAREVAQGAAQGAAHGVHGVAAGAQQSAVQPGAPLPGAPQPGAPQPGAVSHSAADAMTVKVIAEVESRRIEAGREVVKLEPADRVVPGDQVIYTVRVRNGGTAAVESPTVTEAIPEHTRYVMDSAVGPGATVSYSVDGGRTFDRAENLSVQRSDDHPRPAAAADITHIRWQLKNSLKSNSVAFVRFRAVVK